MQKLVFVVDDNDSNLAMAAMALEDDFRVLTMPSAKKMFSLLEKKQPDLILLDVEMPETDGRTAISNLKSDARFKDIPVVFLTGIEDGDFEKESDELGAKAVVVKPFEPQKLVETVNKYIDN